MNPSHAKVRSTAAPRELQLTPAVRPAYDHAAPLLEGYRLAKCRDAATGKAIPVLTAAVSADRLFDAFLDLIGELGELPQVVLETSHEQAKDRHSDLRRSDIDRPVLASYLCDCEQLLLEDGCCGVAVIDEGRPAEVQLDEHKLLHVYADDLRPFRRALHRHGVRRVRGLEVISDEPHLHYTHPSYAEQFVGLARRLGVGDFDRVLSDENF